MLTLIHFAAALAAGSHLVSAATSSNLPASSTTTAGTHDFPTATVKQGVVIGTSTSVPYGLSGVNKFLGIPFAQSPPERFSPPQRPKKYGAPLMAQKVKPACIQQFVEPAAVQYVTEGLFNSPPPPAGESEDCLYLNVWAPDTPAPKGGRAVMFWLYGGSFAFGTGTLAAYDGAAFAAYQDVVLVTHNYRTNLFGFSGSPDIPLRQRNAGLYDQRRALAWVKQNIAAFGGDPNKVTIFGESAGSFSVDTLLTSYETDEAPFRAAILESGQISFRAGAPDANVTRSWEKLAKNVNCTGSGQLECMRKVPAAKLKASGEEQMLIFRPVADNVTLVSDAAARRQAGKFAAVPVLIGSNQGEGRVFELGQTDFDAFLETTFGSSVPELIPKIKAAYPKGGYNAIAEIQTLIGFQCGTGLQANQTASKGVPTWRYYFNATFPNLSPFNGLLQVWHSSEISLVFQTYFGGPLNAVTQEPVGLYPSNVSATAAEFSLSRYMSTAWANFAKNPDLGPGWNRLGSFDGLDVASLGANGTSGATMIRANVIDAPCQLLLPAFKAVVPGDVFGL